MTGRRRWLKRALIGGGVAGGGLLLWSVWVLFRPLSNGIPIGPETTVLDGPLDAAGYVDYAAALYEAGRIPPEENAAVAVFRAFQSKQQGQIPRPVYRQICEDLGVDPEPDASVVLPDVYAIPIDDDVMRAAEQSDDPTAAVEELLLDAERAAEELRGRPWASDEHPRFAAELRRGDALFAVLKDGVRRPGWWHWPRYGTPLIERPLPMLQDSRSLARFIKTRAMNHIGDGDLAAAAEDIDTGRRLGQRIGQSPFLIGVLIGSAVESIMFEAEADLLWAATDADFVRGRLSAIEASDSDVYWRSAITVVDGPERFMALEIAQIIDRNRRELAGAPPTLGTVLPTSPLLKRIALRQIDPAELSRRANAESDAAVAALGRDTAAATAAAEMTDRRLPRSGPLTFLDGDAMSDQLVAVTAPVPSHLAAAAHRVRTRRELLRVLAAGRLFELATGRPPASIDDLVPDYLPEWPTDHYDGEPLRHRTLDGIWTVHGRDPQYVEKSPPGDLPDYLRVDFPRLPRSAL